MSNTPPTFDARRIPLRVISGRTVKKDAHGREDPKDAERAVNHVALCFDCETRGQAETLHRALMQMRELGLFKIETRKPAALEAAE